VRDQVIQNFQKQLLLRPPESFDQEFVILGKEEEAPTLPSSFPCLLDLLNIILQVE